MTRLDPKVILMAIRPKTLGAAIAPVLMGTALAYYHKVLRLEFAAFAMLGALLIQIGTNLANDYFDFVQGADTEERLGPVRVTQAGLLSPTTVKWWFVSTFAFAVLMGVPLMVRGGWPIILIGILSVISGVWYTKGSYSLAYTGLADIFVLIFFGPVAVGGTYFVQGLTISWPILVLGAGPGLVAMGLLAVNNLRDIDNDRKADKLTLAVRFGPTFARLEYTVCFVLAALLPWVVFAVTGKFLYTGAASLVLLLSIPTQRVVWSTRDGEALNGALAATGKWLVIYSLLFSVGLVLSVWIHHGQL
jgi:1,4-dihydroxy-2-naphthoate octaprenyltransferase